MTAHAPGCGSNTDAKKRQREAEAAQPVPGDVEANVTISALMAGKISGPEAVAAINAKIASHDAALIEQARAEGKAEADAAWAAKVEALVDEWSDPPVISGYDLPIPRSKALAKLRALIPADAATALTARDAKRQDAHKKHEFSPEDVAEFGDDADCIHGCGKFYGEIYG